MTADKMNDYVEVSKEEFYDFICGLQINVHPYLVNSHFPFSADWNTSYGNTVAKTIDYIPEGKALAETKYLLRNDALENSQN